jgi:hypothetical protein
MDQLTFAGVFAANPHIDAFDAMKLSPLDMTIDADLFACLAGIDDLRHVSNN